MKSRSPHPPPPNNNNILSPGVSRQGRLCSIEICIEGALYLLIFFLSTVSYYRKVLE